jgi:hypothetical protein
MSKKSFFLTASDQFSQGLGYYDEHGSHRTDHSIINVQGRGRWIADGRYDVTNAINQPDGAYVISVIVGER